MMAADPLRAVIVAELERQARAGGYWISRQDDEPLGWDAAEDGPFLPRFQIDGTIDLDALCHAIRETLKPAEAKP